MWTALTRTIFWALNKKNLWNSVHYELSYKRSCWPTLSRQCAFGVYRCIWVRATWLWCQGNFTLPLFFPKSDLGRRADSRWALPQISSLFYVVLLCDCHWPGSALDPTLVSSTGYLHLFYFVYDIYNNFKKHRTGAERVTNGEVESLRLHPFGPLSLALGLRWLADVLIVLGAKQRRYVIVFLRC